MLPLPIVIALAVGVALLAMSYFGGPALAKARAGRLALLVAVVVLPLLLSVGNLSYGFHESSQTTFCLSCHEMQRHGQSLFVDDKHALAAIHYQNRFIDRETVCYSCHKDYALFGDVRAKLNAQVMEPVGSTPVEFKAQIEGEIARWTPVIQAANIKVN